MQSRFEASNDEGRITIKPNAPSYINFLAEEYCPEYDRYELHEVLINGPSRHSLYGKKMALEFELIYRSSDEKELVVLSVFGEPAPPLGATKPSQFLQDVTGKLFPQYLKTITAKYEWSVNGFLPAEKERTFFSYQRSKAVRHIVFETPLTVPVQLVDNFKNYVTSQAEYAKEMATKNRPVKGDLLIYATVPPPVQRTLPVPSAEGTVEHMENPKPTKPSEGRSTTGSGEPVEQDYGFAAISALITYLGIVLIGALIFTVFAERWTNPLVVMYQSLANGSPVAGAVIMALLMFVGLLVYLMSVSKAVVGIGLSFIALIPLLGIMGAVYYLISDRISGSVISYVAFALMALFAVALSIPIAYAATFSFISKYFSYLGWYLALTALVYLASKISSGGGEGFSFNLDQCPEGDAIAVPADEWVGVPKPEYGYAEPASFGYAEPAPFGYAE